MKTKSPIKWYDRQGKPLTDDNEIKKLLRTPEYRIVKQEKLKNGKWILTVWLGINYSFMGGKPLIFETMVFPKKGDYGWLDMDRYSTEEEAIEGHNLLKEKWDK